ncbi:MAG: arginase family protein [Armatimonadota bacterium]|nr:arginase family protein [Armatimonadota bacterium]
MSAEIIPFAGCFAADPEQQRLARVVFVGLPDDSQSSYRRGARGGPARMRAAYDGRCYNSATESGVDLAGAVADLSDWLPLESWEETAASYRDRAAAIFRAGRIPFFVGGDHAVTVPVVAALEVLGEAVHIVQIDAHPDLYPAFGGSRASHACTAARMLEMDHVAGITQIGVRTTNAEQAQVAAQYRSRLRTLSPGDLAGRWRGRLPVPAGAPVYVSVDLDGLDPSCAPGVSHPVPGGLTTRQVLDIVASLRGRLVGMDVVELNPDLDVRDLAALAGARILHEGMGVAARQLVAGAERTP